VRKSEKSRGWQEASPYMTIPGARYVSAAGSMEEFPMEVWR
jgi:hypothetical protein